MKVMIVVTMTMTILMGAAGCVIPLADVHVSVPHLGRVSAWAEYETPAWSTNLFSETDTEKPLPDDGQN